MSQDERRRRRPQSNDAAPPPSFAPGSAAPRPDARGARPIGTPPAPEATRPMPAGPQRRSVRSGLAQQPGQQGAGYPPAGHPGDRGHAGHGAPAYAPRGYEDDYGDEPGYEAPARRPARAPKPPKRRRTGRRVAIAVVILLVLVLAWPIGLLVWANGQINHVEALSGAAGTPGRTYLLAGSDSRADGAAWDSTEGERSDTIMVLHQPDSGPSALISLPRDTFTEIPGHGNNKLNAAYSLGGPPLLVESVEGLTGLTVDHYVEIGMAGVRDVVDAVGGVELCLDYDVDDWRSRLEWEAGCHEVDGETALSFARMRYADPEGDIGRTDRQRQIVGAVVSEAASPGTLLNPMNHVDLLDAGVSSLVVDEDSNIIDMGRMALAFRGATGSEGMVGPPPIADYNYRPGGVGSTVLLDPDRAPDFFAKLREGTLTEADFD